MSTIQCSTTITKLPKRANNGQTICDPEGNLWQYDSTSKTWINKGTLEQPPIVTESQNGLVTTQIYDRLQALKEATNSGRSLPDELKIKPHTNVYWYLFHSSDRMIRFTPEATNILRMEIDRGRLFQAMIARSRCGPKGQIGEKGDSGDDGPSNGPEPCYEPTSIQNNGAQLNFDITVQAPLETDILLRLTQAQNIDPVITIAIKPTSGQATYIHVADQLQLDRNRTLDTIKYDFRTQKLTGSFILVSGTFAQRCILARQKGPVGDDGDPGTCVLETDPCTVTSDDIQFTSPIISIRRSCNSNQLYTLTANLFDKICVSKLSFNVGSPDYANLFSGSIISGRALAAETTLEPCKNITTFKPRLTVIDRPLLELPDWQPQLDCDVSKRAQISDLNWVPATATSSPKLQTVSGEISPQYPWTILIEESSVYGNCDPCDGDDNGGPQEPPCPDNQP